MLPRNHSGSIGCSHLLLAGFVLYHIFYAIRVLQQAGQFDLQQQPSIWIQVIFYLSWGFVFALLLLGLARGWRFALRYTHHIAIAYGVSHVVRLALLTQAPYDRQRLPLTISIILVLCILPYLIRRQRPRN